jgi:DNA (cytosine-5)-methyltransferase 1
MTVGSLFSGVGGFDLGFEQAGFTVAWQVEADEKARRVLRHRWPSVPIHDDVRTVGAHNLAPVEVLVGGFPCQDLSVAGQRKGLAGERSGLFFEFMRIAAELRPSWVVIENVPGLLTSDRGRDFHAVLATLADIGYGDRAYRILDSKYLGVAQRRRRVFIVASAGAEFGRAGAVLLESTSSRRDSAAGGEAGARVAATLRGRSHRPGVNAPGRGGEDDANWQSGGEVWLNVGPQTSALTGHQTPAVYQCHGSDVGPMGTLRQGRGDVQSGVPFVESALSASLGHYGHSSPRGDGSDNLVAATLNSGGNSGGFRTEPGEHLVPAVTSKWAKGTGGPAGDECQNLAPVEAMHGVRRLTPLECERLQGFPDGHTCICGAADEYRSILRVVWAGARSKGVSEREARELCNLAASEILRLHLREEGASQPRGRDSGFWQEARTAALSAAAVRGVRPEGATAPSGRQHVEQHAEQRAVSLCVMPHEGALAGGDVHATSDAAARDGDFRLEGLTALCVCPDSPRYRQMGNAVTVPVIRWIAERLRAVAARRAA